MNAVALNKAAELLRRARGLAPERLEVHERLAQVLPLLPAREEAREEFLWLCEYYRSQEDLAEARRQLEKLLELGGEDLDIRRRLARLHLEAGEPGKAAQALSGLAEQARAKGQMAEARRALEEALEIDANRTDLRKRLIELHEEIGARQQALSESFSLAETLLTQGKPEEARAQCRLLQRAVRGQRDQLERLAQLCVRLEERGVAYSLYLDLAHQEIRSGRRSAAIGDVQKAQSLMPEEEAPYELLTDLLLEEQRKEEAVAQLRELANLHRRKKATGKLLSTLRRLLAIDSNDLAMREELIECLTRQEDTEALLRERTALARAYRRQKRFEEALFQYQQVLGKSPVNLDLIGEMAQLLVDLKRGDDALEFYLEQAQSLERLGARPEAEQLLRQALALREDFAPAREHLVHLYQRMERPQAALEHCEFLARLAVKQGQAEAAIHWLKTIVELDPGRLEARRQLAQLYQQSGQEAGAVEVWIETAEALAAEGSVEQAEQWLQDARETLPEQTPLTQALIRFYEGQERFEEAAAHAQALADVFLQRGNRSAAAETLNAALPRAKDPEPILRRLISLHGELGNRERQVDGYRRLAEHYRQAPSGEKAEQALEGLLALEPNDLPALRALSECRFSRQDVPGACEVLDRVADLLCSREQRQEAVAVYRRILEHQEENQDVREKLIALLSLIGASDEAVRELSALAKQCLKQGDSARALQALDQAVGLGPDNTLLRREYADALRASGQNEAALQQYLQLAHTYQSHNLGEKALEVLKAAAGLWPDNLQVAGRLADLYEKEGLGRSAVQQLLKVAERQAAGEDWTVARQTLQRVLEIDPHCLEARRRQAEILVRLARPEEASVEFLHIARQLAEAGDLEQAQRSLEQAYALPPEYREEKLQLFREMEEQLRRTTLQKRLGQAGRLLEDEQWEAAEHAYGLLLADYPDCVEAKLGLARLKQRTGAQDDSRSLFLETADGYRKEGHIRQATGVLQELLRLWPQQEQALERLCELEESSGNLEEAGQLYLRLAEAREKAGRLDVAMEMCEKVLQREPDHLAARDHMAHLLELLGRREEAYEHRQALAKAYHQKGLVDEAIESYRKAAEMLPERAGCRAELARVLEQAGRREEAIQESLQAAQAYWKEGQRDEAAALLAAVLRTDPEQIEARKLAIQFAVEKEDPSEANVQRKQLAAIYLKKRLPRRAVALYREALEADPKDIVTRRALAEQLERESLVAEAAEEYLRIGDLYAERGISGKAITFYRMAQKASADPAALHERIADAYLKENLKDKAVTELLALAELHQHRGRAEEAVQVYEQILDFDPGNLRVLNKLARCYEAAHNAERSVGVFRQIIETYLERGILGKAIQTCRKALESVPHETSLRERLAELLTERGALKEAKQEYERLLKYSPGDLRITTLINQLNKKISGEPDKEAKPSARPQAKRSSSAPAGVPNAFFDPYLSMMSGPAPDIALKRGQAGMEYFERKRFNRAIEELTEAINLWKKNPAGAPSPFEYFIALGLSYLEMQQSGAAVEVFLQAIGSLENLSDEQLLELRYNLALAYEADGRGEEALKIWKAIYNVDRAYRDVANKILWSRIASQKKKAV